MNYRQYFASRAARVIVLLALILACIALSNYYAPENQDPCEGLPPVYGTDC